MVESQTQFLVSEFGRVEVYNTLVTMAGHTVDGSFEIRLTPVEVASLSHYLQGFSTIPGGFLAGFLNHQPYDVI